jgi:AcrR family transcriptional regulator
LAVKRKSREERNREILDTGKRLLLEKGFSLTTKNIADAMGVSETYIYTFYPNKKAILEAVYADHFNNAGQLIRLGGAGSDYRERLMDYFFHFYRHAERTRTLDLLYLLALEKSDNRPGLDVFRAVAPSLTKPLEDFLYSGVIKGYFRPLDPVSAADFIHSAFFHMVYHYTIFLKANLTDTALRDKIGQYLDLFLNGIRRPLPGSMA